MLSCKNVSHLTTQALDRRLTLSERWGVWLHLRICAACRNFNRQMSLIRQAMRRLQGQEAPPGTLPGETKARIRQALEKRQPPEH